MPELVNDHHRSESQQNQQNVADDPNVQDRQNDDWNRNNNQQENPKIPVRQIL
jgi:hypothetical protein